MNRVSLVTGTVATAFLLISFAFLLAPRPAAAAGPGCDKTPTACLTCVMDPKAPNFCPRVQCTVKTPVGSTQGMCVSPCKCNPTSIPGQDGKMGGVGDMGGIVTSIFKGLLDQLMKPKPPGNSPPPSAPAPGATGNNPAGCTTYYQVTVPTSDPCATYIQPTSASLLSGGGGNTAANQLLQALSSGTPSPTDAGNTTPPPPVSDLLTQTNPPSNTTSNTSSNPNAGTTATVKTTSASPASGPLIPGLAGQSVNLQSGTKGDIVTTNTGVTVVASARDTQANSEVAGFYGSDTFGGAQSTGIVAKLCQARPWAAAGISFIIPPTFFDSLCAWRGYQVGTPAPATPAPAPATVVTIIRQQASGPKASSTPAATGPVIPPEVDIWAVPPTVPLGARTSIFWNTKGVASCTETSPDGSFNQNTLSGGASTVPITGATTFTISCLTPDGKPVTAYVTVNLAI